MGGAVVSLQTVGHEFVELCNQGKNFDVMRAMYAPDIVSVEANGEQTVGKTPVIQKSERWGAANTVGSEKVRGPYFFGNDQFAVHYTFGVTPKATGQPITIEEVGVYTVKDDQITREQFYYEGSR
jgi:hypothetical protein